MDTSETTNWIKIYDKSSIYHLSSRLIDVLNLKTDDQGRLIKKNGASERVQEKHT